MPTEEFDNERARISKQRDDIMDIMTIKFKEHIANNDMNRAMALADEYFEWLHPDIAMHEDTLYSHCLLYTSPSPRDGLLSRMPSSA